MKQNTVYSVRFRQKIGKHFARVDGNLDGGTTKKYFYHTDHLGSTVLVTDDTGKQVWSGDYTPFGKQNSIDGSLDHVTQFTGKDLVVLLQCSVDGFRNWPVHIGRSTWSRS